MLYFADFNFQRKNPILNQIQRTLFFAFLFSILSTSISSQTIGPQNGKLMIVGGGDANLLVEKFVELAGGEEANIVVIPTAGEREEFSDDWGFSKILKEFGAKSVVVIHTRDPKTADTKEFCAPLKDATGIWFSGG